jgi:hypothetical protein
LWAEKRRRKASVTTLHAIAQKNRQKKFGGSFEKHKHVPLPRCKEMPVSLVYKEVDEIDPCKEMPVIPVNNEVHK